MWLFGAGVWIAAVLTVAISTGRFVHSNPQYNSRASLTENELPDYVRKAFGLEPLTPGGLKPLPGSTPIKPELKPLPGMKLDADLKLPPPLPGMKLDYNAADPMKPAGSYSNANEVQHPTVTYSEQLVAISPVLLLPPLLVLILGLGGFWVTQGFSERSNPRR